MSNYLRRHLNRETPQSEPLDENQIQNAAGGYVYKIDTFDQVKRFLVMGTEGGTYYTSEADLTKQNFTNLSEAIKQDGVRVVDMALEVSDKGLAAKNDFAIFALAVAMAEGDLPTKRRAREVYTQVARTGTHHLMFADFVLNMRGVGKLTKFALGDWYKEKTDDQLAFQVAKYQNREGWTHRDVLQKIHWGRNTPLYRWITRNPLFDSRKNFAGKHNEISGELPSIIQGYEVAKDLGNSESATDKDVITAINQFGLTHEMVPNRFKNSAKVWEALLVNMPVGALLRNLGKMSSLKMFPNLSDNNGNTDTVLDRITPDSVKYGRLHPITILGTMKVYQNGAGVRGNLTWTPNQEICERLEEAFYWGFKTVEPTGKNLMLALDVSGSMTWSYPMASSPQLSCAEIAAVIAMVTARTERRSYICGFADTFRELPITKRSTLQEAISVTRDMSFGGTDCALPMQIALKQGLDVDGFCVYTDNETWSGGTHPKRALEIYRNTKGRDARLAVLAMTATDCSIADPNVDYMADFVGISSDTPRLMSQFIKGEF